MAAPDANATGKMTLSRRQLLDGSFGIGAYLLTTGTVSAADHVHGKHGNMDMSPAMGMVPDKPVPAMDQPLIEPEVRRSANGVLSTTLRAAYAYRQIGGVRLYVRSYEGGSPGPTLRMKPGETLRIKLINDLPPNRDSLPADISRPHQFNNTNFHFHGAHASPSGIADNVMRSMAPGRSYEIEIKLPEDHTRGTYWYHPHHHGSADIQMSSGMVGALIVEGDFADVPEIAAARERMLVLTQVVYDAHGMIENFETLFPETATRFLAVNGQRRPMIEMRPGEVQRWRILNAAYQDDMLLDLEKHDLHAVAYDGIQLGAVQRLKQLLIAPGQRADVLVQAGAAGTYALDAKPYDQGHPSPVGPTGPAGGIGRADGHEAAAHIAAPAAGNHQGFRNHQPPHGHLLGHGARSRCRRPLAGIRLLHRRQEVRSRPHRSTRQARRGRGMDDRQHA